jgi:peptidoglycan hydrolase-like protein with peptidoglycan-binding domain
MLNRDVRVLYSWVRVGTPVKVVGRPRSHFGEIPRTMRNSTIGSDVMRLQTALKQLGLYRGRIDGRFGSGTEKALRDFQWATFRKVTGVADQQTRQALGLP